MLQAFKKFCEVHSYIIAYITYSLKSRILLRLLSVIVRVRLLLHIPHSLPVGTEKQIYFITLNKVISKNSKRRPEWVNR